MKTEKKQFTVGDLSRRIGIIDLTPDFQRGKVWNLKKQQLLVDSIIKEWGIPKLYLAQNGNPDKESYFCIDGKQRLITMFEFLQNKIRTAVDGSIVSDKLYTELPIKIQDDFDKYKVDIELVLDAKDIEISELFKRLQNGSPLNSGEKLNAISGEMASFSKYLIKNKFFKNVISIRDTRYSHLATSLQITLLGIKGEIQNLKYKNLENFLNENKNFNEKGHQAKHVLEIINFIKKIFPNGDSRIFSNRGNIISVFFLIHEISKKIELSKIKNELPNFLIEFYENISNPKKDREMVLEYQNSIIQAADSITSIKRRHDILLRSFINFDKKFESIFNVKTKEEEFKDLYFVIEKKFGNTAKMRKFLKENDSLNVIKSSKRGDTDHLVMFVRDAISHRNNKSYSSLQLEKAKEILKNILEKQNVRYTKDETA